MSCIARPVESNTVISLGVCRAGFLAVAISPMSAWMSLRVMRPWATATLISPLWEACSQLSITTFARFRIAGSSSCLPLASAPMALMCVPGRIQSDWTIGERTVVVVVTISASFTASLTESAQVAFRPCFCLIRRAKCSMDSARMSNRTTFDMFGLVMRRAWSWVAAWVPVPMQAAVLESGRERYFAATPPAAPVRIRVMCVPSMIASGKPVSGSIRVIVAMTAGRASFAGWTLTFFTPAVFMGGI